AEECRAGGGLEAVCETPDGVGRPTVRGREGRAALRAVAAGVAEGVLRTAGAQGAGRGAHVSERDADDDRGPGECRPGVVREERRGGPRPALSRIVRPGGGATQEGAPPAPRAV